MRFRVVLPVAVAHLVALGVAAPASATTFCVPSFHPACPNSGGNVAQASLETALQSNAADDVADRIVIAAGTFTDPETFETAGTDDLEIVGAGPGATLLTSSLVGGNSFVVNLSAGGDRAIVMRDLTIVIPASFADGLGSAIQVEGDALENVDIQSRNDGSDGAVMHGGSSFADGRLYGAEGGQIDVGIRTATAQAGAVKVVRTTIENPIWGVSGQSAATPLFLERSRIVSPQPYGVLSTSGGIVNVRNSVIEIDEGRALSAVEFGAAATILNARHVTIVDTVAAGPSPIEAFVNVSATTGSVNLVVSDTIVAGNEEPLFCKAPEDPAKGNASLSISYSWFFASATVEGDCTVSNPHTIDSFSPVGPPQFPGPADFHLPVGSPAIDAGDPLVVALPTEDFDGAPRPVDGDGDGNARRDVGAFEYQPPGPEAPEGGGSGGGTNGGQTLADFGAKTAVTLALARKRIGPGQRLKVRIVNRNGFAVSGSVAVETWGAVPVGGKDKRIKLKPKLVGLGAASRRAIAFTLPDSLRALLLEEEKMKLRLLGRFRSPAGTVRTVRQRVAVRLQAATG